MGDSAAETVEQPAPKCEEKGNPEELQCTICLSSKFTQECRIHGCNHSFCFICISEWLCQSLRPSCPMCRNEVDKVFYDFAESEAGKKEVAIKEYRSGHISLTPTERNQLLSERRLVVRNLMHAYKITGLLSSDICDIEESVEPDEMMKTTLLELRNSVKEHIKNAEGSLSVLRTEDARKNKSTVFNTMTFRKMIYTLKIKVRYTDQKRPKLGPTELANDPDRFKSIVKNFLISEFDAIPYYPQPKYTSHKWNTKFLGENIDDSQKEIFATQIYELMLTIQTGNDLFQREVQKILQPVRDTHIKLLEDHLEAIIAIEKPTLEEFYNEVYYDSIYNSLSNGFFDYHSMMNMREDPSSRIEAIFQQISRGLPPHASDWYMTGRLYRQSSNTDGTDRATNNDDDDDSDRSVSPEERVPTPMPDMRAEAMHLYDQYDQFLERQRRNNELLNQMDITEFFDPRRVTETATVPERRGQVTRTLPYSQQTGPSRSHMTLRSSARRDRELAAESGAAPVDPLARPQTRREVDRRAVARRTREFEYQSHGISRMFLTRSRAEPSSRFVQAMRVPSGESRTFSTEHIPVYTPSHQSASTSTRRTTPRYGPDDAMSAISDRIQNIIDNYFEGPVSVNYGPPRSSLPARRTVTEIIDVPFAPEVSAEVEVSTEPSTSTASTADSGNNGEELSIAQRTRSHRRARNGATSRSAPPPKRVRRDRS